MFTKILYVECPEKIASRPDGMNEAFTITFETDGEVPFVQIIIRGGGMEKLFRDNTITRDGDFRFIAHVEAGTFGPGRYNAQIEGCQVIPITSARGENWIKQFRDFEVGPAPFVSLARHGVGTAPSAKGVQIAHPRVSGGDRASAGGNDGVKIYFGIHKHMHQPYYNAADPGYWDGQKDEIFGSRVGPYTHFVPAAVRQYADGGLPHGGLTTTWSGTLVEQLDRCAREGLCGGRFSGWNHQLRELAQAKTSLGNPRMEFAAFGFYHPLMALVPPRDIVKQVEWHRTAIRNAFGVEASRVMFPPETAFHVRMIPALVEAGVKAVMYDSIHRYRACKDYPYAGLSEGMLPPNRAEQENPPVNDWLQLHNIWAGSKISPSLLRPEYVKYVDPEGKTHQIIAIPAERYIGNEDARGGFGALQYPDVLGQVHAQVVKTGSYDPKHPPFFMLHSDGDNHGGGSDCYYMHNTGRLVEWLKQDPRFELITPSDYLQLFPPDPANAVHIEPGSWSGADNGDPQFMKWFSRYNEAYSPDLNSWAVLTALQNVVHTLEDCGKQSPELEQAVRLLLTAETSCYWYWTGQVVWDTQVTNAANAALGLVRGALEQVMSSGMDRSGPTIFAPWVTPENPGGKTWGQGCLKDAAPEGVVHTFVDDISGVKRVTLVIRGAGGESRIDMRDRGPYPTQTGAKRIAQYFTAQLPVGVGDIRYYIEAEDGKGNISRSALERVFCA